MRTFKDKTWTLEAANANGQDLVFWMGLFVNGGELGSPSYERRPVNPQRTKEPGFLKINGLFVPREVWNGITAVGLWARPEGGQCLFLQPFEPTSAEPGFTLTMTLRVRDTADWKTLLSEARDAV